MIHKHNPPLRHVFYNNAAAKANVAAPSTAKLSPIADAPVFLLAGVTEDVADVAVDDFAAPVVVELEFDDEVELDLSPPANVAFTTAGSDEGE